MLQDKIEISGKVFTILPYTEKRREALAKINAEIQAYIDEDPTRLFDDIPKDKRAEWWRRKAAVLLRHEGDIPDSFWTSDDFEFTLVGKVEDFFMISRVRL